MTFTFYIYCRLLPYAFCYIRARHMVIERHSMLAKAISILLLIFVADFLQSFYPSLRKTIIDHNFPDVLCTTYPQHVSVDTHVLAGISGLLCAWYPILIVQLFCLCRPFRLYLNYSTSYFIFLLLAVLALIVFMGQCNIKPPLFFVNRTIYACIPIAMVMGYLYQEEVLTC